MLKLLIDAHVFDGKFQGTRTYLQGLYQNMVYHKDIDFYFAAQDTDNLKQYFGIGDNIHYVKLKTQSSTKRLLFEIPNIIKKYEIDYAHYQYISTLGKFCKEIVTIHDLLFLDYPQYFSYGYKLKNGFFFRRSAKKADILLTVSEYSRNEVVNHFGISKSSIYVTPNAVLPAEKGYDINIKEKLGLDKYILTVSRIEPRKNHLMLLKAFVDLNLASKGYKLVMIGAPDLSYKEFHSFYENLKEPIKSSIIMKSVSFNELVELYRQANLFVFPSYAEGFGIPPLEAIEYGCPVLCSNATAMSEFKLPDEWSFNPYNIEELKQKMTLLLKSHPEIEKIQDKIRKRFNWKETSEMLYKIIVNHNDRKAY